MEFGLEFVLIVATAAGASLLTFFSGFGLGTLLLPVFVLFFPVDLSIAMVAIVHFLNNIYKTSLIGGHASRGVVLKFGIPALVFAFLGALTLGYLTRISINFPTQILGFNAAISPVKVVIGLLLLIFAIVDIIPGKPDKKPWREGALYVGGALSGFFGGLSGHQGALRTAFLIRMGLTKEVFIASGILISLFVDISRITVYWSDLSLDQLHNQKFVLLAAVLAAFGGAFAGRKLLRTVTLRAIQLFVGVLIGAVGVLLIVGIL
ncbi:MAG: sulfite exporter TauE/SafE family protein [Saprospiraceae bacterium]|nr:sulfite exporter TauE/SafE family protein [Saprospiraceae bacterium]